MTFKVKELVTLIMDNLTYFLSELKQIKLLRNGCRYYETADPDS